MARTVANPIASGQPLDLQPHLWAGEDLLWWARPSTLGDLLANLRHSFTRAGRSP